MKIESIAVFCGSSEGGRIIFKEEAKKFAKLMANNNIKLVYGGGNIGLMGAIADEVLANGGEVIGVIPDFLLAKEIAHQNLTDLKIVKSMSERKNLMNDFSDAFVALPGGFGTLDEIMEVLTYFQLNINAKPVGFLNTANFYDNLIKMFDTALENKFLKPQHRNNMVISSNPKDLLNGIINFETDVVEAKWIDNLKKTNKY